MAPGSENIQTPRRADGGRSGQRYWYRITGLPGWKRAELGMPAFGHAHCVPHPRTAPDRKLFSFLRRLLGLGRSEIPVQTKTSQKTGSEKS